MGIILVCHHCLLFNPIWRSETTCPMIKHIIIDNLIYKQNLLRRRADYNLPTTQRMSLINGNGSHYLVQTSEVHAHPVWSVLVYCYQRKWPRQLWSFNNTVIALSIICLLPQFQHLIDGRGLCLTLCTAGFILGRLCNWELDLTCSLFCGQNLALWLIFFHRKRLLFLAWSISIGPSCLVSIGAKLTNRSLKKGGTMGSNLKKVCRLSSFCTVFVIFDPLMASLCLKFCSCI